MKTLAPATLALLAALAATPSLATDGSSCELSRQPDGFVALRDAPSMSGRLILRMPDTDAVIQVMVDGRPVFRGNWMQVIYWREGTEYDDAVRDAPRGWMHRRLMDGCG